MDTNLFKYMAFIKTVEYGSFTRAAHILNYSQSGISRMINDLEREWNVALLERSRAGVKLTSDGMKLLPYAKKVCEEHARLQNQVEELNGLQTGLVRIGTFSSVATHWIPNMIREFQRDYPNVDYELLLGDYDEIEEWMGEGRVDCGFVRLPVHREFETIFLERDPLLAVLPEGHPLCSEERVSLQSLCREKFILLERGGKTDVSEIFERNGLLPCAHITTWDDYAIMSMVEGGLGVSILPKLILRRIPYRIVTKELDVPAYRDICFALKNSRSASLAVRRFMDYIKYR